MPAFVTFCYICNIVIFVTFCQYFVIFVTLLYL